MVHIEQLQERPRLSVRGRGLFREAARIALDPTMRLVEDMQLAALSGEGMRQIAGDPMLAESGRQTTRANILHWVTANLEHPGERVATAICTEALAKARDLVQRGLDKDTLEPYRTAQSAACRAAPRSPSRNRHHLRRPRDTPHRRCESRSGDLH